jgi:hypothetical protein
LSAKEGFWMSTHTGKRMLPLALHPDQFCIEDIAMGLSNVTRFSGQGGFYSVAEHSVRGARHAREDYTPGIAFEFLMHDAAEAYMGGDMVKPIVEILDDYRTLRERMQTVINHKFGLPPEMSRECKDTDRRMLVTEAPVIFHHDDKWWEQIPVEPYHNEWVALADKPRTGTGHDLPYVPVPERQFWPPRMAHRLFMELYQQLRGIGT